MACLRIPGPLCFYTAALRIDSGTLPRVASPRPGTIGSETAFPTGSETISPNFEIQESGLVGSTTDEWIGATTSAAIAKKSAEVMEDYRKRGVTYQMGGKASQAGKTSDCSNFVHDVMLQAGLNPPYVTTSSIAGSHAYLEIPQKDARGGDIIVQGGHMGILTGTQDAEGRPIANQMGNSGPKPGKFGPSGWFNPTSPVKIYRPRNR